MKPLLIANEYLFLLNQLWESQTWRRTGFRAALTSSEAVKRAEVWAVLSSRSAEMIPRARPVSGGSFFVEQCCRLDMHSWLRFVAKLVHLYWHGMTGLLNASWIEKLPSCTSAAKASA